MLDLLGIDAPREFEGRSIVPVVAGAETAPRSAYVEAMDANLTRNWAPLTGIVSGAHKLIDVPVPELYDLTNDPRENTNLFARAPDRAQSLKSLLASSLDAYRARGAAGERAALGAEARQRLQALGYVASSGDLPRTSYGPDDDPKALVPIANDLNRAIERFESGDRSAAVSAVSAIREAHPRFSTAYAEQARMLRASGDLQAAIRTLEDAARSGIANQRMMTVLAGYLTESGQLDKAKTILDAVLADHPDDVEALNSRGVVASRSGDYEGARTAFARVVDLDPTSARAYANLATVALARGQLDAALPDLRRAIDLDARSYGALFNLGMALWQLNRRDEARPYLERFAREAPPRDAEDAARVRALLQTKIGREGRTGTRPKGLLFSCSAALSGRGPRRAFFARWGGAPRRTRAEPRATQPETYQTNLRPIRPVRGPRIVVGCWNVVPVVKLIVSAAYTFSRLKASTNRRSLVAPVRFSVFSARMSNTEMLSWRKAETGVRYTVVDVMVFVPAPPPFSPPNPAAPRPALKVHAHEAGGATTS